MKKLSESILQNIITRLVSGIHPLRIILFGSYAYGQPTDESDIDLLIVVEHSDEPRYRRARKAYQCLRGLTTPTDIIVMTSQEIEESHKASFSPISQIVYKGKVIYESAQI